MATQDTGGPVQPGIFEDLQRKIDEDSVVKDVSIGDIDNSGFCSR